MSRNNDIADCFSIIDRSPVGLMPAGVCLVNSVTHRQCKTNVNSETESERALLLVITDRSMGRLTLYSAAYLTSGYINPASGYRNNNDGSLNNVGTNGYYWSASPNNASNGYNLNFNSSNVNPSNNNNRANGLPVRCVQVFTS